MHLTTSRLAPFVAVAIVFGATVACGRAAAQPLSLSKVERAYSASGFKPVANLAVKKPSDWLGDFYLGEPEPFVHVTVFETEAAAKHASPSGFGRTIRVRNVVVSFLGASRRLQARIEHVLRDLASSP